MVFGLKSGNSTVHLCLLSPLLMVYQVLQILQNFMASKLQDQLNTHSAASCDSLYDSLKSSASFCTC